MRKEGTLVRVIAPTRRRTPAPRLAAAWILGVLGSLLAVAPAAADDQVPGAFTGYAFDARCAPTQQEMDAWLTGSPFWGAGIYIGGSTMSCRDGGTEAGQPHLDAEWVRRQTRAGWRLLPLWVGPQASCSGYGDRIDPTPTDAYAAADAQGRSEAAAAARRAKDLGIPDGSTLWYDLEGGFDVSDDDCRRSALRFLSGWTERIHRLGYRSGVYSSVAAGIHALDNAANLSPGSYRMPDQVWYAWNNGRDDVKIPRKWVRPRSWAGQRVHQYSLDEPVTYGGVSLVIDRNFLKVGGGSKAGKSAPSCGVRVDFADYRRLSRGDRGKQVKALQCLLKKRSSYRGQVDGRFDGEVRRAVRVFQRRIDLPVRGRADRRTWTALLSGGKKPLLKFGSAGEPVRRVQRALNVATAADLAVTGVLTAPTERWVRTYQRKRDLPVTGVVTKEVWRDLQRGRR